MIDNDNLAQIKMGISTGTFNDINVDCFIKAKAELVSIAHGGRYKMYCNPLDKQTSDCLKKGGFEVFEKE